MRNVKTIRAMDTSVLDAPMKKVGKLEPAGAIDGAGKTLLIQHNTDNTLATLRFRLAGTPMDGG